MRFTTISKAYDNVTTDDTQYRILIVEDDRSQALFAQSVLQGAGIHAQIEMSASEVLKVIEDYRPDLILMDLNMPELDGISLTTLIRQQPNQLLLPIVFLSGDTDPEKQFEVLDSGADDFLTKPIQPRHLIAAVSNRMHRLRQQQQNAQQADTQINIQKTSITELQTRIHIVEQLEVALSSGAQGALFFIEVSSALNLRTRYGYTAFERLMNQVEYHLAQEAHPYSLARISDHSFLLLAIDLAATEHQALATHLREHLATLPLPIQDDELVHLRSAIGYATLNQGFKNADDAVECTESATLEARQNNEGIYAYVPLRTPENTGHLALLDGQLELAYQPIVEVAGSDTAQYQVLLRLRKADGNLLSAGLVIPAAEAAGRIMELDQQVIEQALDILKLHQDTNQQLRLFVSQSVRTLIHEGFSDWIIKNLRERNVNGTGLVIDLRLQDAVIHAIPLKQLCKELLKHNVKFCLSQFESNSEATVLFSELPLNFVRLSQHFGDAHNHPERQKELPLLIEQAHEHNLHVIGQCIEDAQAATFMWMNGVDLIQGNLFQNVSKDLNFNFHDMVL
ncbi:EAL domain-containing protein [Xylella fastidiosa]|uniref:EAL domain-containing protein n=1 Tax=Xylella fastidiosa TaxID=2371 RepID=UPI0007337B22|nr:EAL domain-containing response regulator [Xylella fastidiosa]